MKKKPKPKPKKKPKPKNTAKKKSKPKKKKLGPKNALQKAKKVKPRLKEMLPAQDVPHTEFDPQEGGDIFDESVDESDFLDDDF